MSAAKIIAEAAKLPLPDAAYTIWRQKSAFIREIEEASPCDLSDRRDALTHGQRLGAEDDLARTGASESVSFQRVKQAHPRADDAAVTDAILAAIRVNDDCMRHFVWVDDFWDSVIRAVDRARRDHPDYLETTYRDARNNVAYYMK